MEKISMKDICIFILERKYGWPIKLIIFAYRSLI